MSKEKLKTAIFENQDGSFWAIKHNLTDTWGLNIENAYVNYLFRDDNPTAEGFCKYITSKDPNFKAYL